jgi:hypothetical protein
MCRTAGLAGVAGLLALLLAAHAQDAMAPGAQDAPQPQTPQQDPPSVVARLSVMLGIVSVEPASVNQFSAAEVNDMLTTGDRMYADTGANAELETGIVAVRLGQQTDLTVTAMTDPLEQFGLAQGSVHLRSYPQGDSAQTGVQPATIELDTPIVAVTVVQPGDVRVDVDPSTGATTVTDVEGEVQVDGDGLQQVMQPGQRARFVGSDPVAAQWLYAAAPDGLDQFSADRDAAYASAMASEQQDVNPDTIGAGDLAAAGEWQTDEFDQPIWYPTAVGVDWVPYSCGHWGWVAPWGWTWIDCAAWGFAPFHYGRWEYSGHRWGWLPGPPIAHPVYAPALVVFVGGPGLAIRGEGVTAWFPLGPREPYTPWYHTTPAYLNRVNVANIYDRNAGRVRSALQERDFATGAAEPARGFAAQGVYTNRVTGTVAVSQAGFAAGRPVSQTRVQMAPSQLATAAVLPHPLVTPERSMVVPAAAKALPPRMARPMLNTRAGDEGAERSSPQPSRVPSQPASRPAGSSGERTLSGQPAPGEPQPAPRYSQPAPVKRENARQPASVQPSTSEVTQPGAVRQESPGPPEQPRTLYNRSVPPPPRPGFEEQQRAMQGTDPGRPLSPQQMQSLRQNQPVQPTPQRETPHPPPAFHPAPAPRPAPPAVKH